MAVLKDIMTISGQGGLFKFLSQAKSGIIVESLIDGKRQNAFATSKISALEDIAIFTYDEEVPLEDVFKSIAKLENGGPAISHKSSGEELKAYMLKILPDYDKERVYVSDIKKVVNWYNLLQERDLLQFEDDKEEAKAEEEKDSKKSEEKNA